MAFNEPTQPGQTRYPNMLPVQAQGYPNGSFLALLKLSNPARLAPVIAEGTEMAMSHMMKQIEVYKQAAGPEVIHDGQKELAQFLLRKPVLWQMCRDIFPKDCDKEWVRYTLLCERAYKGEFQGEQMYDPEHVRAIWQVAAMALGVVQGAGELTA